MAAYSIKDDPLVYVLRQTNQIRGLHTIIRDKDCSREV